MEEMVSVKKSTSCRLCLLDSEDLIHIFEMIDGLEYVVADVIEDLLNLKVSRNDTYPHLVCKMCLDKLVDFRNFKNQCYKSKFTYDNMLTSDESNLECETRVLFNVASIVKEESVSDEEDVCEDDNHPENLEFKSTLAENDGHSNVSCGPVQLKQEVETFDRDSPPQVNYGPIQLKHELASFGRESPQPPQVCYQPSHSMERKEHSSEIDQFNEENFSKNSIWHYQIPINELAIDCSLSMRQQETYKSLYSGIVSLHKECLSNKQVSDGHSSSYSGPKQFVCEVCGKTFNRRDNFREHQRVHSGEKPFVCYICGKKFSHKSNLTVHHRLHSGEKPFMCDVCNKRFSSKSNLNQHTRIHTR